MAQREPSSPTSMPTILGRHCSSVRSNRNRVGFIPAAPFRCQVDAVPVRSRRDRLVRRNRARCARNCPFSLQPQLLLPATFFSFSPIGYADLVYLTFCAFCALAVGWVSALRRRTEQELRQAHEELEATVAE